MNFDFKVEDVKLQEQLNSQFPVGDLFADPNKAAAAPDITDDVFSTEKDFDELDNADPTDTADLDDEELETAGKTKKDKTKPAAKTAEELEAEEELLNAEFKGGAKIVTKDKPKTTDTTKVENQNPIMVVATQLKDKGLLLLPEDFDGSEESLYAAHEDTINKRADSFIDSIFNDSPEKDNALALFEHMKNGGKVSDFIDTFSQDVKSIDITDEDNQEKVVRALYKRTTRLTDEKITAKIAKLKQSLLLESEAEDAVEQLDAIDKEKKQAFIKSNQEAQKAQADNLKSYIKDVKEFVGKTDSIKNILPIKDTKTKNQFLDYMFKPAVKLADGRLITQSYADSLKEQDDIEAHLTREYLRFKKYDLGAVQTKTKNEVVSTLADKLMNASKDNARVSTSGNEDDNGGKEEKKVDDMSVWKQIFKRNTLT